MPPCKHHEICGLDALDGRGEETCILHSQDPEKDQGLFDEAFLKHREKKGDDFSYLVFPGDKDFSHEEFTESAYFKHAKFIGDARFGGTKFIGDAQFVGADFCGNAEFSFAEFNGGAVFRSAQFGGRADFEFTKFRGNAGFNRAKIHGIVSLHGAEFSGQAEFISVEFSDDARFGFAEFYGKTYFGCAKFCGNADFGGAEFNEDTDFGEAEFYGKTYFGRAKFCGKTYFGFAKFCGNTDFRESEFSGGVSFAGTDFTRNVHFRNAKFLDRSEFVFGKAKYKIVQVFPGIKTGSECDFTNVIIEPRDAIVFRDIDLTRCRFQGTDLREVEITGAVWPQIGSRIGVYDEIASPTAWADQGLLIGEESEKGQSGKTRPWHHIERLYRELKQNYEDRRDYERASDFHYGEKEMRRKNKEGTNRGLRFLLTLYWLVSGYGERWVRPLIWAAGLLVVCAVLYLFLGLHPRNGGEALTWTSGWNLLESTLYSFRVMTLLKPDDLVPDGLAAKFLNAIQSIVGPIILGFFGLAVRQRLKR